MDDILKDCPMLRRIIGLAENYAANSRMPMADHFLDAIIDTIKKKPYSIAIEVATIEERCERAENKGECVWTNYDDDDNIWETKCGETFQISNGTPAENGMKYCHGCARKIKEVYPESEAPHGK